MHGANTEGRQEARYLHRALFIHLFSVMAMEYYSTYKDFIDFVLGDYRFVKMFNRVTI